MQFGFQEALPCYLVSRRCISDYSLEEISTHQSEPQLTHLQSSEILNLPVSAAARQKPTKWHVLPAKTQISLNICPVWSEPLLSAWMKFGSLPTHKAHSKDSDAQADLRLCWAHRSFFWFCHEAAQLPVCLSFVPFNWRRLVAYIWAASWQNQQSECAPSEDSDQPGHPPSLISLRCPHEVSLGP